ncbi:MAG: hypothetical protein LC116_06610 [Bacteroidetes bacterium]|nr:hypothetical protein [Bacteroidota bacterium]
MKTIICAIIYTSCVLSGEMLFAQQSDIPFSAKNEYLIEYVRLDNSMLKFSSISPDVAEKLLAIRNGVSAPPERLRFQYQRLNGTTFTTFDARQWASVEGNNRAKYIGTATAKAEITLTSEPLYVASDEILVLSFMISSGTEVSLEIVTTQGKSILSGQLVGLQQGLNTVRVPLPKGLRGMYLYQLQSEGATANGAIFIQ